MTSLLCQTIAELGTAANQVSGAVNWEVIPDVSIYDDPMDVDPDMGEWEDIFKEDPSVEGQVVSQGLMQCARLQTIITCVFIFLSLPFYISDCYCRAFGGRKNDLCQGHSYLLHRRAARARVAGCYATTCWPISGMEAQPCRVPSCSGIWHHLVNSCTGI